MDTRTLALFLLALSDALLSFCTVAACHECPFCYYDAGLSNLDGIEASRAKKEKKEGKQGATEVWHPFYAAILFLPDGYMPWNENDAHVQILLFFIFWDGDRIPEEDWTLFLDD